MKQPWRAPIFARSPTKQTVRLQAPSPIAASGATFAAGVHARSRNAGSAARTVQAPARPLGRHHPPKARLADIRRQLTRLCTSTAPARVSANCRTQTGHFPGYDSSSLPASRSIATPLIAATPPPPARARSITRQSGQRVHNRTLDASKQKDEGSTDLLRFILHPSASSFSLR